VCAVILCSHCTLTADPAHLAEYCQQWHLKPNTSRPYRKHLTRTAAKLKSLNNLITKLAGTTWGPHVSSGTLLHGCRILLPSMGKIHLRQSHRCSTSQFHVPDFRLLAFHSGLMASGPLWPVCSDVFDHPPPPITSQYPIWSDKRHDTC